MQNKIKPGPKPVSLAERMAQKIDKSGECWLWTGARDHDGYGVVYMGNRSKTKTHRAMWSLEFGPVPAGMCVCHRCDNPSCVKPSHLFLATHTENMRDKVSKGRHVIPESFLANGPQGARNFNAKLSESDVRAIRSSTIGSAHLASIYSVSQNSILNIRARRTWRHI